MSFLPPCIIERDFMGAQGPNCFSVQHLLSYIPVWCVIFFVSFPHVVFSASLPKRVFVSLCFFTAVFQTDFISALCNICYSRSDCTIDLYKMYSNSFYITYPIFLYNLTSYWLLLPQLHISMRSSVGCKSGSQALLLTWYD